MKTIAVRMLKGITAEDVEHDRLVIEQDGSIDCEESNLVALIYMAECALVKSYIDRYQLKSKDAEYPEILRGLSLLSDACFHPLLSPGAIAKYLSVGEIPFDCDAFDTSLKGSPSQTITIERFNVMLNEFMDFIKAYEIKDFFGKGGKPFQNDGQYNFLECTRHFCEFILRGASAPAIKPSEQVVEDGDASKDTLDFNL